MVGAAIVAYLRGRSWKDALGYITEKIEKQCKKGGSALDVKEAAKSPEIHEVPKAKSLAKFIAFKFPKNEVTPDYLKDKPVKEDKSDVLPKT